MSENQHEEPQSSQPPGAAATAPEPVPVSAPVLPVSTALPDPRDRSGARALFIELRALPDGSAEKAELRNRLVRMHLPLVEHLARRFRNRGEPLDDLTQVATIGLIKSVDRFDPDRGVEFSTYATPTVVGEIKRHFRDKGWAVRVPRRLQELRLSLTTATAELSQQHGRSPTVHELAERLGISEEEVLEGLESANAYSTLSSTSRTPTTNRRPSRTRWARRTRRWRASSTASRSSRCWRGCLRGRSGSCCCGSSAT